VRRKARVTSAPAREGDVRWSQADLTYARVTIGYDPEMPIDEGIERTVASFRDRFATDILR